MSKYKPIDTKRLTEKLRLESERKFCSLIRYIPDVLWTLDENLHLVYVGPNFKTITGYTPNEEYEMHSGKGWVKRLHPDDRENVEKAHLRLFQEKKPLNIVYRLGHKEGGWVWVHDRAIAVDEKSGVKYAHGFITNTTAQKEMELGVKSLKEKYESVIRNVPDTIYSGLPNKSCSMVFISDKYEEWTGYSPQDFYDDPELWPKTIHPEDRDQAVYYYEEACGNKMAYVDEYRIVHRESGEIHWVRDHGIPALNSNGDVEFLNGVITDITESKQISEKLMESEERYRLLVDNIPDATWTTDDEFNILFISPNIERITGYTEYEESQYKDWMNWSDHRIHHDDLASSKKSFEQLFQNKQNYDIEYRLKTKGGRWIWVNERSVGTYERDGQRYVSGTMVDITTRREIEIALNESELFNSGILNNSPNSILVTESTGAIKYVNPALERITGYSLEELLEVEQPYPWLRAIRECPIRNQGHIAEEIIEKEKLYQNRNGEEFWVRETSAVIRHNDGSNYLLVNWTDITEKKILRDNMQFYIEQVTIAQEDERKRLAMELHDESIQYLADLYNDIDHITMNPKVSADISNQIHRLRDKVYVVMEQLRHLSHELRPGLLDDLGLLPSIELLAEETGKKDITCHLDIIGNPQRLPAESEIMLFRIAQEALRNIRKHSRGSEVSMIIEYSKGKVTFDISDNGIGFDVPSNLSSFATQHKMGIMGMQERVRLVGGSFFIKSKVGGGTRITAAIPI